MSEREIKVTFPGGFRVDAEYKGFTVKTDQPVHAGGEGAALSPFDLFLTSIATCAGYYVLAFSRERGIPTEGAAVVMRMEKNPETKMIGKIKIEINLPPEFPVKYKNAVIKAVNSCTVTAHLMRPPAFEIVAKISS
jgi:ribosomal protein S12 methylthiotransferase accessory factor